MKFLGRRIAKDDDGVIDDATVNRTIRSRAGDDCCQRSGCNPLRTPTVIDGNRIVYGFSWRYCCLLLRVPIVCLPVKHSHCKSKLPYGHLYRIPISSLIPTDECSKFGAKVPTSFVTSKKVDILHSTTGNHYPKSSSINRRTYQRPSQHPVNFFEALISLQLLTVKPNTIWILKYQVLQVIAFLTHYYQSAHFQLFQLLL